MKIAHLLPVYLPVVGGAQVCIHNISERHSKKGDEVTVIVPFKYRALMSTSYTQIRLWPWTQTLLQSVPVLGKAYFFLQLKRLQKRFGFELWQVTIGHPFGTAAVRFLKSLGTKVFLRCSGDDIQMLPEISYGMRLNPSVDRQIRAAYPCFDIAIAISEAVRHELENIGVDPAKIHTIPNGVDNHRFQSSETKSDIRRRLGIKDAARILLTVGRNHPKKGFSRIPEVLQSLLAHDKNILWMLVGPGHDEVIAKAKHLGVQDALLVRELTRQGSPDVPSQELIDLYHAADIFVFPTLIETFGIVVIEAMAAGLPVVSTRVPGVQELVSHGTNGFLSDADDMSSIVKHIQSLSNDRALYERVRQQALAAAKRYDWSTIADEYQRLYHEN
jgi:glycosyltransferase involved in cell wall biosynthesis